MKTDEQLLTELAQATDGLLFMSESDYPFEPVRWSEQTELTLEAVRRLTGHDESAPIETQSVNGLFHVAASEADWKNAQQLAAARRYQALMRWLQDNLTAVRVYRIGRIQIDVFIVGRSAVGSWVGLQTRVIET
jgi:Nuclease A inhibitor-like protein